MNNGIYVVSKIKHVDKWKDLRARGYSVISTWIDDGLEEEIDFSEAWPRYLSEAARARFVIVYAEDGDVLKGGLLEVGAALAQGAYVYVIGKVPQLRTVRHHLRMIPVSSIEHALALMRGVEGVNSVANLLQQKVGRWVERCFGAVCLFDMKERACRVFEEAVELAQVFKVSKKQLFKIINHVYSKPVGEVEQEMAGVGVALNAAAYAWGVSLDNVIQTEVDRVHSLPVEHFKARFAAKIAAGISMPKENKPGNRFGVDPKGLPPVIPKTLGGPVALPKGPLTRPCGDGEKLPFNIQPVAPWPQPSAETVAEAMIDNLRHNVPLDQERVKAIRKKLKLDQPVGYPFDVNMGIGDV